MAVISLPTPTARRSAPTTDYRALEKALRAVVRGDVRFDAGARAAYSTDASNYRQVPIAVVCPVDVDDAVAAVRVCHEHDVPVLNRGGGTSFFFQAEDGIRDGRVTGVKTCALPI